MDYKVINYSADNNSTDSYLLPTSSKTWYEIDTNGNKIYGYGEVFSIVTYSLDEWNRIKKACGTPGSSTWGTGCVTDNYALGKTSITVFAQGIPPTSGPNVEGDAQWGKLAFEIDNNYLKNNFSIINP